MSLIVELSYESLVGSSLPTGYGGGEGTAAGTAGLIGSVLDDGALDALHGRIAYGAVEARTGTHSPRHQPSAPPHSYYTSRVGRGSRGGTLGRNASTGPGRRTSCGGSGASTGTGARSSCGAWPAGRSWDGGGGGEVRAPRLRRLGQRLGQRQRRRRGLLRGGFDVGGDEWPERGGINESAVVWWSPRSDDIQGGRSARRGGSVRDFEAQTRRSFRSNEGAVRRDWEGSKRG